MQSFEKHPVESIKAGLLLIILFIIPLIIVIFLDYTYLRNEHGWGFASFIACFPIGFGSFWFSVFYFYYLINKKIENKSKAEEFYKKYGKLNIEEALDFYKEYQHQINK